MSQHYEQYLHNIDRVNNLVELFAVAKDSTHRPTIKEADILRAAVVFLHSAFENYFRDIIISSMIKLSDNEIIKNVPFFDCVNPRLTNFNLSQLIPYKGEKSPLVPGLRQQMSWFPLLIDSFVKMMRIAWKYLIRQSPRI